MLKLLLKIPLSFHLDPCFAKDCMYEGECLAKADDSTVCECNKTCPEKIDSVCASDGNTYINECELKRQSCLKKKPMVVARKGSCGKFLTTLNERYGKVIVPT